MVVAGAAAPAINADYFTLREHVGYNQEFAIRKSLIFSLNPKVVSHLRFQLDI